MTPRDYLSWSSLDLFEKSVESWKDRYLFGKKAFVNRGMAYGKAMAEGLEHDRLTGDMEMDLIMERLPKFEVMDKEFRAETKARDSKKVITMLCKPDTMKADMSAFKEYKTGQGGWSQAKVDSAGQITFYATGMYLRTGRIPSDIELVHVLTEKDPEAALEGKIRATGEIRRYRTRRDMLQILAMIARIRKAWDGIEKTCEEALL